MGRISTEPTLRPGCRLRRYLGEGDRTWVCRRILSTGPASSTLRLLEGFFKLATKPGIPLRELLRLGSGFPEGSQPPFVRRRKSSRDQSFAGRRFVIAPVRYSAHLGEVWPMEVYGRITREQVAAMKGGGGQGRLLKQEGRSLTDSPLHPLALFALDCLPA